MRRLEVDEDGLDALDRRYLNALVKTYSGGPVGADTLAAALSEARDAIEEVIEPYLMQQGFVARTPRGRVATPKASERVGLKAPAAFQQPLFEDAQDEAGIAIATWRAAPPPLCLIHSGSAGGHR